MLGTPSLLEISNRARESLILAVVLAWIASWLRGG
jgi:hypothetical protein